MFVVKAVNLLKNKNDNNYQVGYYPRFYIKRQALNIIKIQQKDNRWANLALAQTTKGDHQHRRDDIGDKSKAHHQRRDVYAPCLG